MTTYECPVCLSTSGCDCRDVAGIDEWLEAGVHKGRKAAFQAAIKSVQRSLKNGTDVASDLMTTWRDMI